MLVIVDSSNGGVTGISHRDCASYIGLHYIILMPTCGSFIKISNVLCCRHSVLHQPRDSHIDGAGQETVTVHTCAGATSVYKLQVTQSTDFTASRRS